MINRMNISSSVLGLRVQIPWGAWFVLCVLSSKDKRQMPGQSGQCTWNERRKNSHEIHKQRKDENWKNPVKYIYILKASIIIKI